MIEGVHDIQVAVAREEKVNVVSGAQSKDSRYKDLDLEEVAKYLNREVVNFRSKSHVYNYENWSSRQGNQGQRYYIDKWNRFEHRYSSRDRDGNWRKKDDYKDKGSLYFSLRNRSVKLGNLGREALLVKFLKGSESQDNCL